MRSYLVCNWISSGYELSLDFVHPSSSFPSSYSASPYSPSVLFSVPYLLALLLHHVLIPSKTRPTQITHQWFQHAYFSMERSRLPGQLESDRWLVPYDRTDEKRQFLVSAPLTSRNSLGDFALQVHGFGLAPNQLLARKFTRKKHIPRRSFCLRATKPITRIPATRNIQFQASSATVKRPDKWPGVLGLFFSADVRGEKNFTRHASCSSMYRAAEAPFPRWNKLIYKRKR